MKREQITAIVNAINNNASAIDATTIELVDNRDASMKYKIEKSLDETLNELDALKVNVSAINFFMKNHSLAKARRCTITATQLLVNQVYESIFNRDLEFFSDVKHKSNYSQAKYNSDAIDSIFYNLSIAHFDFQQRCKVFEVVDAKKYTKVTASEKKEEQKKEA